jgi:predicted metal-dependent phosphoesterase TrpH
LELSTSSLVLTRDTAIDLQLHTIYSDGTWTPEQLIDYLASEHFGLAAITDHDRVDTAVWLQRLAIEKQLPLLVAVEMSTSWRGEATDLLCYGFDPEKNDLKDLTQDIFLRQQENTREVYENLQQQGILKKDEDDSQEPDELTAILEKPSAQQPQELLTLLKKLGYGSGKVLLDAGFYWETRDIATVVEAAHRSGGVCLLAHPGRGGEYTSYDVDLLDELRREVPIDGFEVYYPAHTRSQIAMYLEYAHKHNLLTSSGSDSHGPDREPIKYQAELSRSLLERLGIQIK